MRGIVLLMIGSLMGAPRAAIAQAVDTLDTTGPGVVLHMHVDDQPITPVTARFIERAIREAEEIGARCLVLELDTPGGLVESTQDIVKDILASRGPANGDPVGLRRRSQTKGEL